MEKTEKCDIIECIVKSDIFEISKKMQLIESLLNTKENPR